MSVACHMSHAVAGPNRLAHLILPTQRVGSSRATKACHSVSATCMVSVVATQQASAAAAAPPRTALSAEQVAALTQQIRRPTQWVIELQQRLQASPAAQPQQNQAILTGMELKIERFGGNGGHNWNDNVKAILRVRRPELKDAVRWLERRRDQANAQTSVFLILFFGAVSTVGSKISNNTFSGGGSSARS